MTEGAPTVDELFETYDEGLRKILAVMPEERVAELAADGVVASILLAHDLYPVSLEDRVREALEEVRPYLESHDGGIELLGVEDGIVRLRMQGSCNGCGASFATLEAAVESALRAHAPDLEGMDVEGAVAAPPERPAPSSAEWVVLPVHPSRGAMESARGLMVANVAGTLLAYRDWCAGCPAPLSSGMLVGGTLTCTACGRAYDLPRAGREKDGDLQLEPVPLLRSGGQVKVSVPPEEAEEAAHGRDGHCELCPVGLSERHQHLLNLVERRIVCVCSTCWSLHSGDPEYRATGGRTVWLDDFALDDEAWSGFQIPIGLAFMMKSSLEGQTIALYPSPAGVTEAELDVLAWTRMTADNPVLEDLAPDAEALIVNRLADPPVHVIAPLDDCYRLVGMIKSRWTGINGGPELSATVDEFFAGLREGAIAA
jgi:Fe-S cluster biogenesis protein NfuA/nitrite reductase/ring-hydroxylating ferredoxin subunit